MLSVLLVSVLAIDLWRAQSNAAATPAPTAAPTATPVLLSPVLALPTTLLAAVLATFTSSDPCATGCVLLNVITEMMLWLLVIFSASNLIDSLRMHAPVCECETWSTERPALSAR